MRVVSRERKAVLDFSLCMVEVPALFLCSQEQPSSTFIAWICACNAEYRTDIAVYCREAMRA